MARDFDLIVIGTGAGGGIAAHRAAVDGKKVAVVEGDTIGGECPNYGCVPTKALLQAAEVYQAAKHGARFGVRAPGVAVDYIALKAWKDAAVLHTGTCEGKHLFEHEGIQVISGRANFVNRHTIEVNGEHYKASKFLIATGSHAVIPPIPGLSEHGYMTYREAINLTEAPKSVFVIGGGPIGVEFAHLFSSLDVKTHIVDIAPHLLPLEDREVGELLSAVFERRGMKVDVEAKVVQVDKEGDLYKIQFEKGGQTHVAHAEALLVASGKAANVDLGLENAGVKYDRHGIKVNRYMQTTAKNIYATGDVVGPYGFTHTASYQSRLASHNMWTNRGKVAADYHAVPRCVFVDPEVATVGLTESQLQEKGVSYQIGMVPINMIGRANTADVDDGFVKVIATPKGRLLSASIVSPRAGEMVHELTLAIQHRMTAKDVASTIHAFPTWSESVRYACQKLLPKTPHS